MSVTKYVVTISHRWNAVFEADSEDAAKEQALALDEEIPCDDMGTDVEVEAYSGWDHHFGLHLDDEKASGSSDDPAGFWS